MPLIRFAAKWFCFLMVIVLATTVHGQNIVPVVQGELGRSPVHLSDLNPVADNGPGVNIERHDIATDLVRRQGTGVYQSVFSGWSELDRFTVQPLPRPNVRLGGGGQSQGGGPPQPGIGRFNEGFLLGAAFGRYLNQWTRVEAEGSWRSNSGRTPLIDTGNTIPLDGHINNYSAMFNLLYDTHSHGVANLYGGLGIGVSRQDGQFSSTLDQIEFEDWAFAYQAIAGVNFRAGGFVDLFAEYRYFGNTESQIQAVTIEDAKYNYVAENILFGLRIKR